MPGFESTILMIHYFKNKKINKSKKDEDINRNKNDNKIKEKKRRNIVNNLDPIIEYDDIYIKSYNE